MFDFIKNTVSNVANIANIIPQIGIKSIKYFVDSQIRDKVVPVEGSVLYCDLLVGAEHSGIYVGNNTIADIVVNSFMKGTVKASTPKTFVDQTTLGNKIYVSCNDDGAVGHRTVSSYAHGQVGKKSMYGLVFKNCHTFSERCVEQLPDYQDNSLLKSAWNAVTGVFDDALDGAWEASIKSLKKNAQYKLGATKWRLWDWQNKDNHNDDNQTLDWKAQEDYFKNMLLNQNSIQEIREQLQETSDYLTEIGNENIDKSIHEKIVQFKTALKQVIDKHDETKDFLALYPSSGFSYNTLTQSTDNLNALSHKMKNNPTIQALVKKMGRNYISEERKKAIKVPRMNQNEVYGTHNSDDIMRLLPNEL
ncbi:MAG: hypothetical protein RI956_64, partial [Pseudomonadota bacterium]